MSEIELEIHNALFFIENGDNYWDALEKYTVEDILIHLASELYGKAYLDGIEYISPE